MLHRITIVSTFVLVSAALMFLSGCVDADLKAFSGRKNECFNPTPIGQRLSWGTRFIQETPIMPGTLKFKFDFDSLTPGEPLPNLFLFTFTHKNPRGAVLFTQSWDVEPRADGSIPFQTVNVGSVTVKKKESFVFDLTPIDRTLPKSDFVFNWKYRAFDFSPTGGKAGAVDSKVWFKVEPSELFRAR